MREKYIPWHKDKVLLIFRRKIFQEVYKMIVSCDFETIMTTTIKYIITALYQVRETWKC